MEKTSYKLKTDEFQALYELYEKHIVPLKPQKTSEILIHTLQLQIWVKLRKLDVDYKKTYKLQLSAAEEIAFMIYWGSYEIEMNSYISFILLSLINLIQPKYA